MLKQLRKKQTAKKIFLLLAIIIIPAFVLWGASSTMRSDKELSYAGKMFGKKVSMADYFDSLEAITIQGIMRFGENFSKIQNEIDLKKQAWVRLILLDAAKKQKIKVTDKELITFIQGMPFFQKNGKFDNKVYQTILNYGFDKPIAIRDFEEKMRQSLMIAKLFDKITDDITLSDAELTEGIAKLNKNQNNLSKEEKDKISIDLLEEKKQTAFRNFLQQALTKANLEDKISNYKEKE